IDLDPEQIGMNFPAVAGIVADADAACRALLQALPSSRDERGSDWGPLWDDARAARHPRPEWLIESLRSALPDAAPVSAAACEIGYRMQADWPSYVPRAFFCPSNYITLGWAFPAAVGAAAALEGRPVVSVSGDGGFVMCAQELATAARYRLKVIAIVHNDSTLGAIKNIQDRANERRYIDTDLNNPDFPRLAAAYGVPGRQARTPEEVVAAVAEALDPDGPSLIEAPDRWRFLRDLANPARTPSAAWPTGNSAAPAEVLSGTRVDPDDRVGIEMLGDLDHEAGRKRGGLRPAGGRIAPHAGCCVDDRQLHRVRQLDRDHLVVHEEGLDAFHVLGHERRQVAQIVGRHRELVEVARVHEMQLVGVAVQVLDRPPLEARLVERVGTPVALLDPVLRLEIAGLDLVERGGAAGRRRL